MIQRSVHTGAIDLDATLQVLRMLPGDPTLRLAPGRLERATHTPDGPGSIVVTWSPGGSTADGGTADVGNADVRTHGPGAGWLADHAPELLGVGDDPVGFDPSHPPLRALWRRHLGLRIPRTGTLWHDLIWLVVQQRVRRTDAASHWRRLVERYGDPAPGATGLRLPPSPERLAATPYHELHRLGIERRRADTLRAAALAAGRLGHAAGSPVEVARPVLETVPGIGPWTTSTLAAVTWGDPDAVIVGDSGIPSLVSWVVAREPRASDDRMLALLEPYRPHRYRVVQLAFASGLRPPRGVPRGR